MIYGGKVDLRPVLQQRLFDRLCRIRKAHPGCRWGKQFGTQVATFRKILRDENWQEGAPWSWRHPICDLRLTIPAAASKADVDFGIHQLREAWRGSSMAKWAKGDRHEALQWSASDAEIAQAARCIDFERL